MHYIPRKDDAWFVEWEDMICFFHVLREGVLHSQKDVSCDLLDGKLWSEFVLCFECSSFGARILLGNVIKCSLEGYIV